jgi:hypothetical protein
VAWADRHQRRGTESPLNEHMELVTVARVRLAAAASDGERDKALGLLDELTMSARHRGWNGLLIETLLLLAKARLHRFGPKEALGAIDEAVRLAHKGGFFQTVVEEGTQTADLLRAGMDAGKWTDPSLRAYVMRVLGAV